VEVPSLQKTREMLRPEKDPELQRGAASEEEGKGLYQGREDTVGEGEAEEISRRFKKRKT